MFDFTRRTLFYLGYRLLRHKMTIFYKNVGDHCPLGSPWLRVWLKMTVNQQLVSCKIIKYIIL